MAAYNQYNEEKLGDVIENGWSWKASLKRRHLGWILEEERSQLSHKPGQEPISIRNFSTGMRVGGPLDSLRAVERSVWQELRKRGQGVQEKEWEKEAEATSYHPWRPW